MGQIINSERNPAASHKSWSGLWKVIHWKRQIQKPKKQEIKQMAHTHRNLLPRQAILTWCRAQCTTERGEEQKEAVSAIFYRHHRPPKPLPLSSNHHHHSPLSRCEWVRFFIATILLPRGEICPCRQCRRQCKIFASSVNFSRNNAIYNVNESTKYILSWFYL